MNLSRLAASTVLAFTLLGSPGLRADNPHPGQVDFGKIPLPGKRAELVEVNIKSPLISLVAKLAQKDEPEVADLLKGLHLVKVHVVGLDQENRDEMEKKISQVQASLGSQGWEQVVLAQQHGETVAVYVKTKSDESVQGLVVTVFKRGEEAVLVNIVGDIRPEKLAVVGERFDIEPLKHLKLARKK